MSTGPADPPRSPSRSPRSALPVLALTLLLALTSLAAGCADDEPPPRRGDRDRAAAAEMAKTLRKRAHAVLAGDRTAFERTLAQRDPGFVLEQTTWFENLAQLPVSVLDYDLLEDTVEKDRRGYWAEVEVRLRLASYDDTAVRALDRFRFVPAGRRGRYLVDSTTDAEWERTHVLQPQPWDLGPIEVREGLGVLGIFDAGTVGDAADVLDSVEQGRYDVTDVVPVEEEPSVVVYALSGQAFVDSMRGLPVDDPERLDAATVPVPADVTDQDGRVASYRMMINPRVLLEDRPVLDRLVRHELTHVALRDRGRGAPLWLTEGLAEYVSVRPMAPSDRRIPETALDLAARAEDLPTDEEFGGPDAEAWYAVSWWICEHIAATYGDGTLWLLLDELDGGADQDAVLEELLGVTSSELVDAGTARMQRTYGAG